MISLLTEVPACSVQVSNVGEREGWWQKGHAVIRTMSITNDAAVQSACQRLHTKRQPAGDEECIIFLIDLKSKIAFYNIKVFPATKTPGV